MNENTELMKEIDLMRDDLKARYGLMGVMILALDASDDDPHCICSRSFDDVEYLITALCDTLSHFGTVNVTRADTDELPDGCPANWTEINELPSV